MLAIVLQPVYTISYRKQIGDSKMSVDDVLDMPIILPGFSCCEPSLRDLILRYYQIAGHGICFDKAEQYAREYIEQMHHVERECFGV
jgi:hypothetical protein